MLGRGRASDYTPSVVAKTFTSARRFVSPPAPVLAGRWQLARFTRDDVSVLLRLGIIPEDSTTELLSGMIALKDRAAEGEAVTSVGKNHLKCVERLSNLRTQINGSSRHVQSQQPLVCREDHVPEPDFVVLRGTLDDYTDLPIAADAYCVIEVADSSYERDAGEKLIGYARAGVLQYIILNLRNRTAEVYTNPDSSAGSYGSREIIAESGIMMLKVGEIETFSMPLPDVLA
jgi:Uma2 family endonuclease